MKLKPAFALVVLLAGLAAAEDPEPRVVWMSKPPGVTQGSAAVLDGQVFAASVGTSSIVSLNASDGQSRWTRQLSDSSPFPPILDQDSVYVITGSCTLYRLSRADGRVVWKRWLAGSINSMPTLSGGRIYAAASETPGRAPRKGGWHLVCLDAATGKEFWAAPLGSDISGAPVIGKGRARVAMADGNMVVFDIVKGETLWKRQVDARSIPVMSAGTLIFRTSTGLSAVNEDDGAEVWAWEPKMAEGATVAERGHVFRYPMIAGNRAYVTTTATELACLDLTDRSTVWKWAGGEEAPGEPVMVGGRVYFGTSKGTVVGLDARSGQTVWAMQTDCAIVDAPSIMDGSIYFQDMKGGVLCVDAGTPLATGWGMWGGSPTHTGEMVPTQPARVLTPSAADGKK